MARHLSKQVLVNLLKTIKQFSKQLTEDNLSTQSSSNKQLNHQYPQFILRWILWISNHRGHPAAGFALPTAVLLMLVVLLTIATLLWRTSLRTEQVQTQRKQQVIYNSATPTLDRARAKLEYLFIEDPGFPGGVPGEDQLVEMMKNDNYYTIGENGGNSEETRFDLDGDGNLDNAWTYTDAQGNTVVYSILMQTPTRAQDDEFHPLEDLSSTAVQERANNLEVRNGPVIASADVQEGCAIDEETRDTSAEAAGWFSDEGGTTSVLYKNFQINVLVISNQGGNPSYATLEMEQDRQLDKGNKWGAWFRNDLEIHPGAGFKWNGALHTEGSMILNAGEYYLISSMGSCAYDQNASEMSVAETKAEDNNTVAFFGQVMSGLTRDDNQQGSSTIHLYEDRQDPPVTPATSNFTPANDSVNVNPTSIALDPEVLFTLGTSRSTDTTDLGNANLADKNLKNDLGDLYENRIFFKSEPAPYVDDTYRADNRLGPVADPENWESKTVGVEISELSENAYKENLTRSKTEVPETDTSFQTLGLDGYWERRADAQGLRIVVGQRLELGNAFGWRDDPDPAIKDPLFPSDNCAVSDRCHEFKQYRTLRDNLAAVQATAVYHANHPDSGAGSTLPITEETTFPVACLATTAHPGTKTTIDNSTNFSGNPIDSDQPNIDFFTGRGTNGWEFNPPATDEAAFKTAIGSGQPLGKALRNLAYFAGDPDGAFPPLQEADIVHPYPEMTMWGDYSNLRRVIDKLDGGTNYDALSLADKTTLQTAGCTVGILAYNIQQLDEFDQTLADTSTLDAAQTPDANITAIEDEEQQQIARWRHLKEQVRFDRTGKALGDFSCDIGQALCPGNNSADHKYPALYYLFPTEGDHPEADAADDAIGNRDDAYITDVNSGIEYQVVDPADIAITPRATADWQLPSANNDDGANVIQDESGNDVSIAFLDKGIFNTREAMSVRVLDVDLDLLRNSNDGLDNSDNWLPNSGIIYAFREDGMREDGIARPPGDQMNAFTPQDPENNTITGISPKPVDHHPDPDRRPHGFRLRNGETLKRTIPADQAQVGMSFVSDNSVYIQGDFNLHSTNATTGSLIEEFTAKYLNNANSWSPGSFYQSRTSGNRDPRFADPEQDTWRPAEILADGITLLSDNFCDGSIEDGLRYVDVANVPNLNSFYGCSGNGRTSYTAMNRPEKTSGATIYREDDSTTPVDLTDDSEPLPVPIKVQGNGLVSSQGSITGADYKQFRDRDCGQGDRKCLVRAQQTRVNAILVQGIIPSLRNQPYGGLHNFPRFIEDWNNNIPIYITGAFLQLNFSTSATGPFDQDAWEPTNNYPSGTKLLYYRPPNRLWGYDVALQLAPVGPVAQRLTTPSGVRSEFYSEPGLGDPYIKNLHCAVDASACD